MNTTLYCPDIECDSCAKVISKTLSKTDGVSSHSVKGNTIAITHDESKISVENLISLIRHKGYRSSIESFTRKTFMERWRDFLENKQKYQVERTMLKYGVYVLLILVFIEALVYFTLFKNAEGFLQRYGWWILYLDMAVVSIGSAMWHLRSYRGQVTSMVGMMVGMTFGMQTGLMIGTIIAATNGLFMGGMAGMIMATALGIYNGRCCGIMGVLEGIMAGIMGGLMGAMIGTMFFVDHIYLLMPVFMLLNLMVMWGLSTMLYEEFVEDNEKTQKSPAKFSSLLGFSIITTTILVALMVFGLKTGLARVF